MESLRVPKHGIGSASKVDILRSALEINHKFSNNSMLGKSDNRTSNQSLGRNRADSAPKLSHTNMKNISQPALEGVVLEVRVACFFLCFFYETSFAFSLLTAMLDLNFFFVAAFDLCAKSDKFFCCCYFGTFISLSHTSSCLSLEIVVLYFHGFVHNFVVGLFIHTVLAFFFC